MKTRAFVCALAWAGVAVGSRAHAQPPRAHAEPAADPSEQIVSDGSETKPVSSDGRHEVVGRLELGYRGSFVPSSGYDPFSQNSYAPQFSLEASRMIWRRGAFSFAPGIGLDLGGSSDRARGDATSLSMQRVEVPLEGRMHFGRWGYALVRLAPGAAVVNVELDEATSASPLTKSRWLFAADLSAGYSWLVWPTAKPWLWLQAEGGYGFVASERLNLSPNTQGNQAPPGVDLGDLSMSGPFFRIAAAASY